MSDEVIEIDETGRVIVPQQLVSDNRAWLRIWCESCQKAQRFVVAVMLADSRNAQDAADLLCEECAYVIATLWAAADGQTAPAAREPAKALGELLRAFESPASSRIPPPQEVLGKVQAQAAALDRVRAVLEAVLEWLDGDSINESVLSQVRAALATLPPAPPSVSGWQPISTAPKDVRVLIQLKAGLSPRIATQSSNAGFGWFDDAGYFPQSADIEGWMPLPAPPAPETKA